MTSRAYDTSGSRANSHAFGNALGSFTGRSTSWEGDDQLCLAILMGLEPETIEDIYDTPLDQRMEKIYTHLSYVPHGLLFCPGPKCSKKGLRWAPQDFRNVRPWRYNRPAKLYGDDGVEVTYPGFVMQPDHLTPRSFSFMDIDTQKRWRVDYAPQQAPEILDSVVNAAGQTTLGVTCPTTELARTGLREYDRIPGVLVSIDEEANRTKNILDVGRTAIYCCFICTVSLSLPDSNDSLIDVDTESTGNIKAQRASIYIGEQLRRSLNLNSSEICGRSGSISVGMFLDIRKSTDCFGGSELG